MLRALLGHRHAFRSASLAAVLVLLALGTGLSDAMAHPRHERVSVTGHEEHPDLSENELNRLKTLQDASINPSADSSADIELARFAASMARRHGDTSLLRLAQHALERWDSIEDAPVDVRIVRANVLQIDHRFEEALHDLDHALEDEPFNAQALLSRAFVLSTIGRPNEALQDCAKIRPNVSAIIRETCKARAAGLTGDAERSLAKLTASVATLRAPDAMETGFALSVAAEIALRIGDDKQAEILLDQLYASDPDSVYARAAYAEFLLDDDQAEKAGEIIGDAPKTERLLLLRALASADQSDVAGAAAAGELKARMDRDRARGDNSHAREYAQFAMEYLKDSSLSFDLAVENWRIQKEPIDARILVIAARAVHNENVIKSVAAWATALQLEDVRLNALLRGEKKPA